MQHTAAKAEFCELHDMCPLGLRNELNVESPSRPSQAEARVTECKVSAAGTGVRGGCSDVSLRLC